MSVGVQAADARDPQRVRALIDEILARAEFRPPERGVMDWLGDRIRDFFDWLGDVFDIGDLSLFGASIEVVYIVFGVLIAAALVWFLRRVQWSRAAHAEPRSSPEARRAARASALLADAREAAARGDLVAATRAYFWALVIGLSERGEIEYRDSWTCREALERGAPARAVADELRPLVPRLDAVSFGGARANEGDVALLAALCERHLTRGRA